MIRRSAITGFLILLSSFMHFVNGQDTLLVRSDLKIKRASDSTYAVSLLKTAEKFVISGQDDSAMVYIEKSVGIATEKDFILVEASDFELLASLYNSKSDWEETLRNYLRAKSAYNKVSDKPNEARLLRTIAEKYFNAGAYKKSAQYSEKEFLLYGDENIKMMAYAAEMTARSYYYLPSDSLSLKWYNAASFYFEKAADSTGYLRCSEKLGALLSSQHGMYDQALEKYKKILSSYSYRKDYDNIARTYYQLGILMFRKNDLNAALANFSKAAEFSEKGEKDNSFLTDTWSDIAICQQNLNNQKEMLQSFGKALQYARESGNNGEAARIEQILAKIYFKKGDNYHAELYCQDCIESAKASGNLDVLQLCYKDYSDVLESSNDFVKALDYYKKHLSLQDSLNYGNRLAEKEAADRLAEFESADQRLQDDLATEEIKGLEVKNIRAESLRKDNELKLLLNQQQLDRSEKYRLAQSLTLERERSKLSRREQEVNSLEQQKEIQQLQIERKDRDSLILQQKNLNLEQEKNRKENELKNEKLYRKMAVGIGVLMVLVALMILYGLISTRKKNQKLAESKLQIENINADLELTNTEVLKQKDIIEQKNQSITDSIQYASRIQTAVLPPLSFLTDWGIENFILYKPKDIVSGDFYWGVKKTGKIIVAAGDCTGHGVPGAFMSMLGHAFLDEIINTREIENAATVLNILRDDIIDTLKQKGTTGEARDGMDISLIILDPETGKLDYAGANNPLYIIRDGKLLKYQADRMPIGIHFISFTPFTNRNIEIKKGDYIYLFSDGFADQFGGPKGKKFMYKPFQDLLLRNHSKPMELQKEILVNTFEKWKGDREQVDDVMIIGMHV
jgi:serine phosphatase RsbU (regulator of sigma subunit)